MQAWKARVDDVLTLPDGRALGYAEWGADDGAPLIFFHGSPGSRLLVPPPHIAANRGVRVVTVDRPGYGRSDVRPGMRVQDWASDVEALADALGIDRFLVLGFSSGTPFALACGAALSDRVEAAGVADGYSRSVPFSPDSGYDEEELELVRRAGSDLNAAAALLAEKWSDFVHHGLREWLSDPSAPPADRRILDELGYLDLFVRAYQEGLRPGAAGMAWESIALARPWGFELSDIAVPVLAWHGEGDLAISIDEAHHLVANVPDALLTPWAGEAHLALFTRWETVLDDLLGARRATGSNA